jgi:23S rRNA (adenine2030-N6)-methyltransferase
MLWELPMKVPHQTPSTLASASQALADDRYSHRYHAGNVGDVWKHCVWLAVLDACLKGERPLRVIESHAGQGAYPLGATGEWCEGIGALLEREADADHPLVADYLQRIKGHRGPSSAGWSYPGSPLLTMGRLRQKDRLLLHEIAPEESHLLQKIVGEDPRVTVFTADGLENLPRLVVKGGEGEEAASVLVLIDPSYKDKSEWHAVSRVLAEAVKNNPDAHYLLWYPIKSLTRPHNLHQQLQKQGIREAYAAELVTTPLELKRNRLNGSGMLLVHPPRQVLSTLGAMAPLLGAGCATHEGRWFTRTISLGGKP